MPLEILHRAAPCRNVPVTFALDLAMQPVIDYDPERSPDSRAWLALELEERVRLVETYQARAGLQASAEENPWMYVLVENQNAQGVDHVRRAMDRLQTQGLSRYEAIRAIVSVMASFAFNSGAEGNGKRIELNAAINALSADAWRRGGNGREV